MPTEISGSTGVDKIQDGSVTSAKIVDGAITNADINSSAAIASTKLSGIGDSTPAFLAYTTDRNQNISSATWTKVTHATELFDSDNKFSSGRFTPGVAGKYVLSGMIEYEQQDQNSATYLKIYKNGSSIVGGRWFNTHPDGGGGGANTSHFISVVATSDTDDYFELYVYQNSLFLF